jgi:hypothetical protein
MNQLDLGLKEAVKPGIGIFSYKDKLIAQTEKRVFVVPDCYRVTYDPLYLDFLTKNPERYTQVEKDIFESKDGSIIIIKEGNILEFYRDDPELKQYSHEGFLEKYGKNPDLL